ncbi:MAG TPA: nucleoside-diphosphate sugar epimerase/dehydratase [Acidimicrobiales bacterium]|nr:nucleoside-diphosphate sugar epimerase/dehydratase [Acidimicrobiales bacterium]
MAVRRGGSDTRRRRRPALRGDRLAARASHVRARALFMVLDVVAVVAAYGVAMVTYFRDRPPALYWQHFTLFIVLALVVHLTANWVFGLYGRIWRYAGIEEARQVLLSAVAALVLLAALRPLWRLVDLERVPLQVVVVGCAFVTMAMGALRFHSRLFAWQRGTHHVGLRVAVIGSRDAGAEAIREMLRTPVAGLVPVAVFDDDGRGHGLSLIGVPVVGGIEDIPAAANRYTIQQVLLAIPNPAPELVERALKASEAAGVAMKILPSARDMAIGKEHTAPLRLAREPRIEDLLGRTTVSTDLAAVRRSLAGQRVLITGAGGSIGSEIARQVAEFNPEKLLLLDHDETHLHDTAVILPGASEQLLVDISDRAAVFEALLRHRPDVVFHAAAHKHVPVLESHPVEAVNVNVYGTQNVVQAAAAAGASRFVLISTDKAVRPISIMGASKRVAEEVVLAHAPAGAAYSVVRFGNVLGSRGSVIPTFARQIAAGGPITVTDPRMTRFFMSVEEAVQLVLQASVLSQGREIFMLEMGKPVRILDLAQRMIRLSGPGEGADIPIRMIGCRPGEKLHEELHSADEEVCPTSHPFIHRLVPVSSPEEEVAEGLRAMRDASVRRDAPVVRELLFELAMPEPRLSPLDAHAVDVDQDPVSA